MTDLTSAEIVSRIRLGLAGRLRAFEALASPSALTDLSPEVSIFGSFTRAASADRSRQARAHLDPRWLWITAATTSHRPAHQARFLRSLGVGDELALLSRYTLGSFSPEPDIGLDRALAQSDEDLSVFYEARLFEEGLDPNSAWPFTSADLSSFRAQIFHRRSNSPEPGRGAFRLTCTGSDDPRPATVGELMETVSVLKRKYLHIYGPDVFTAIQKLCDPCERLNIEDVSIAKSTLYSARMDKLFILLLCLRLLGPHDDARVCLTECLKNGQFPRLTQGMMSSLNALLGRYATPIRPRASRKDFFTRAVQALEKINSALILSSQPSLVDGIIELYCVDPVLPRFLDWNVIQRELDGYCPPQPRTAFITLLMNDDTVRSLFPDVAMRMGKGALVGDLTPLLHTQRRGTGLAAVLRQLRTLPAPAASALTKALLERAIVDRLAAALPWPKRWPKDLPPADTTRASLIRMEALQFARDRHLIEYGWIDQQLEQEADRFRLNYLQGKLRSGRVRIARDELAADVGKAIAVDRSLLTSGTGQGSKYEPELTTILSRYIADRVCATVLFKSGVSVDQAVSNNLRHGIILPRFLRAFDDALHALNSRGSPIAWEASSLTAIFGADGQLFLSFRENLTELLKTFMADHLTIVEGDSFHQRLRSALTTTVHRLLARTRGRPEVFEEAIVAVTEREVKRLLKASGKLLTDDIKKATLTSLARLRKTLARPVSDQSRWYLDYLETNLHSAFDESRQWIGLAEPDGEAMNFTFTEVVKLHLVSSAFTAWDKLKVEIQSSTDQHREFPQTEFTINGKYFSCIYEIAHNLLSNAFKCSGHGLSTDINITMIIRKGRVVFKCTNSVSPSHTDKVLREYEHTVSLAQRRQPAQARRDDLSGFQKIRLAVSTAFGAEARINIPPLSRVNPAFVVEVWADAPDNLIAS